ncbi:MAG: AI-2E family transporter [Treponemataceae bacterium]
MKPPKRLGSAVFFVNAFIAVLMMGAVLKIASSVFIPLTVAMLLSFAFEPVVLVGWKKLKIPRALMIIILLSMVLLLIVGLSNLLLSSVRSIIEQYPKYESRMTTIYQAIAHTFNFHYDEEASLFYNIWEQGAIRQFVQSLAFNASSYVFSFGKGTVIVLLFIYFLLTEMLMFQKHIESAFADVVPSKIRLILATIIRQVTRYIFIKFMISLLTGVLVFIGTLLIGLDFPIIWGFLAFILNFIPNFGSIISCGTTILFALLQFWPSFNQLGLTITLMLGVNFFLGNIIEPRIQGKNLGLSSFMILVSLSVWGWLWGFVGMLLAVPLMAILKIICDSISILKPISIMLGNTKNTDLKNPLDTQG